MLEDEFSIKTEELKALDRALWHLRGIKSCVQVYSGSSTPEKSVYSVNQVLQVGKKVAHKALCSAIAKTFPITLPIQSNFAIRSVFP